MRIFANIPTQPYIGQLYALPTQTINTKFGNQAALPPTTIATVFNWASYGASTSKPNVGAIINIPTTAQPRQLIDKILSVRIDNLGNPVPVYVYFPDTNYTVVAKPNSIVWEPVQTAAFQAYVFAEGFTTGQIGSSAVYLCNFLVPPYVDDEFPQVADLWKASASITRGGNIFNTNFGTPALGDQFIQQNVTMQNAGQLVQVFPVLTGGFYYITSLSVSVAASQPLTGGANGTGQAIFESTGSSGLFRVQQYFLPASADRGTTSVTAPNFGNGVIFQSGPVQWKIDATQLWRLRVDASGIGSLQGNMFWDFTFTSNPT